MWMEASTVPGLSLLNGHWLPLLSIAAGEPMMRESWLYESYGRARTSTHHNKPLAIGGTGQGKGS